MPRALLVEDSAVQRRAISGLLEASSLEVVACEDGKSALAKLPEIQPDVVVADLQLPDVDGLTLVREISRTSPETPVVLMTAYGSEQLVVDALRAGAASYVPKELLAKLLPGTISGLLSRTQHEHGYERLLACAAKAEFEFRLDNDPELITPLVDLLQQLGTGICQFEEVERLRFGVALEQALRNAIFRGNLEIPGPAALAAGAAAVDVSQRRHESPYAERLTDVLVEFTPQCARCIIRDGGAGFDVVAAQQAGQQAGFTGDLGRGLMLMHAFVDEVQYNARGNEVQLVKHVHPDQAQPAETVSRPPAARKKPKPLLTLVPQPGTPPIEIRQPRVIVGRDKTCDVVLPFSDISGHHCQLFLFDGWWFVKDLNTKNGIRVNGVHVERRRLSPGDVLSVATHRLEVQYDPGELGAVGVTPPLDPF